MEAQETKLVLVVDDDNDCRKLLSTVLRAHGYLVEEAAHGEEAIKKLEHLKPVLVVLDIMMPVKNGYEVASWMKEREETKEVPIIMLTAKGESEDILSGYSEYSVDYYITKPFTPRQLLAGVNLVLGITDDIPIS